jgi:peptide/nickel transport system substrate-binding protein
MQRIVRNEGGAVVPIFAADLMAATTKLAHGPVASNIQMDGARLAERWWFA